MTNNADSPTNEASTKPAIAATYLHFGELNRGRDFDHTTQDPNDDGAHSCCLLARRNVHELLYALTRATRARGIA